MRQKPKKWMMAQPSLMCIRRKQAGGQGGVITNFFQLVGSQPPSHNIHKMKEMMISSSHRWTSRDWILRWWEQTCVHLNNKLDWSDSTDVCSCLHLMSRSFGVCRTPWFIIIQTSSFLLASALFSTADSSQRTPVSTWWLTRWTEAVQQLVSVEHLVASSNHICDSSD